LKEFELLHGRASSPAVSSARALFACKPTECRRQRTTSNFFDCSKAHGAGKWRCCKAAASRFFQLQQAARVTGATKKRSLGLELKTFDLLAHG
jgi:hypothetical protein